MGSSAINEVYTIKGITKKVNIFSFNSCWSGDWFGYKLNTRKQH